VIVLHPVAKWLLLTHVHKVHDPSNTSLITVILQHSICCSDISQPVTVSCAAPLLLLLGLPLLPAPAMLLLPLLLAAATRLLQNGTSSCSNLSGASSCDRWPQSGTTARCVLSSSAATADTLAGVAMRSCSPVSKQQQQQQQQQQWWQM
jgi:hypothetical protein